MWSRSHLWNWLIVIIRVVTRVALDHILLLSIKLLLLCRYNAPDDLILVGCYLWYLWAMARLVRCPRTTVVEHLSHVIWRKLCSSTYVLCHCLWRLLSNCLSNQEGDPVSIRQLTMTSETLSKCVLHL